MNITEFKTALISCRDWQKKYFKDRYHSDLQVCKEKEAELDKMLHFYNNAHNSQLEDNMVLLIIYATDMRTAQKECIKNGFSGTTVHQSKKYEKAVDSLLNTETPKIDNQISLF